MPTVTFTWNSSMDAKACPKCRDLNGYIWNFVDEFPSVLEHPNYGVVYDLTVDQTRAHGMAVHNCRCGLIIDVDDSDVVEDLDRVQQQTARTNKSLDSCNHMLEAFLSVLEGYV